jgi:hypothetical protein
MALDTAECAAYPVGLFFLHFLVISAAFAFLSGVFALARSYSCTLGFVLARAFTLAFVHSLHSPTELQFLNWFL